MHVHVICLFPSSNGKTNERRSLISPPDPSPDPADQRRSDSGPDRGRGASPLRVPAGRCTAATFPQRRPDVFLRVVQKHGLSNHRPYPAGLETGKGDKQNWAETFKPLNFTIIHAKSPL